MAGNLPVLKADGSLDDSGMSPEDFAPSGYGLGASAVNGGDSMTGSGFVYIGSGQPDGNGAWGYQVQYTDAYGTQTVCAYDGTKRQRIKSQGKVSEWEFENPPMYVGIEYRTTERWNSVPIYTKIVECGALPNNSTKTVSHGANAKSVLRCHGVRTDGSSLPIRAYSYEIDIAANRTVILIRTNFDASDLSAYVQIWYTKE